jgi:hypothetical protein
MAFAFTRSRSSGSIGAQTRSALPGFFQYTPQDLSGAATSTGSGFGSAVALSHDSPCTVLLVGAPLDSTSGPASSGSVTAFVLNDTDADPTRWAFDGGKAFYAGPTRTANARFGSSLSAVVPADSPTYVWRAAVGAPGSGPSAGQAGVVQTFLGKDSLQFEWAFEVSISAPAAGGYAVAATAPTPAPADADGFGASVALSQDGTLLSVAAPFATAAAPNAAANAGALVGFVDAANAPQPLKSSADLGSLVTCGSADPFSGDKPEVALQLRIAGVDQTSMQTPVGAAAAAGALQIALAAATTATFGSDGAMQVLKVDVARLRNGDTGAVLFLNGSYLADFPDSRARRRLGATREAAPPTARLRRLQAYTLNVDVVLTVSSLTAGVSSLAAANKLGTLIVTATASTMFTTSLVSALSTSAVTALRAPTASAFSVSVTSAPPTQPAAHASDPPVGLGGGFTIEIVCGIAAGVIVLCGLAVGSLFDKSCACFWRNLGMKAATEPTPEEIAAPAKAGGAGAKVTPAPEAPDMTNRAERVAVASTASSNAEGSRASPTNSSSPPTAAAASARATASASASASAETLLGTEGVKS